MEHYLTTHRSTIFQHVGVLIYVFDVESREMDKDLQYYVNCLKSLSTFSPDASIFVLIHKMDLVRGDRQAVFKKKENELRAAGGDADITVFGTSIWNESLYKVGGSDCYMSGVLHEVVISFTGLVSDRSQPDTKRTHSRATPWHPWGSLRGYGGCFVRAHNFSCHCNVVAR
jgi:Gtr1/RagA G protein conserved region